MRLRPLVALAATLAAVGCADAETTRPVVRDPLAPYPATGVTRDIALSVKPVKWEVGVGAVYDGLGYDGQIPGPLIEVNAGDRVRVTLDNQDDAPHSVHTHVVKFASASDGTAESVVAPGETKTVEWDAVYAGSFPYHDHADEAEGIALGLFGMLVVHAPDEEKANEQIVVLADFEPKQYDQLPGVADPDSGVISDAGVYHGGHQYMHTINGRAYEDGVPPFHGKVGQRTRWRVVSIGQEFHTWHVHGHRWLGADNRPTDNVDLGPGMYTTFEFIEDNPGDWLVHCHVPTHMEGGMMATYAVEP